MPDALRSGSHSADPASSAGTRLETASRLPVGGQGEALRNCPPASRTRLGARVSFRTYSRAWAVHLRLVIQPSATSARSPGLTSSAFCSSTFPLRLSLLPPGFTNSLSLSSLPFSDPLISRRFRALLPSLDVPQEPYFPFHSSSTGGVTPAPGLWRGIQHLSPARAASPRPQAAGGTGRSCGLALSGLRTRPGESVRGEAEGKARKGCPRLGTGSRGHEVWADFV